MNKATQFLFQFGNTKEEINKFTEQVQMEVINGEVDPHKFQGIINALVKGLSKALEHNQANLPQEKYEAYGFTFTPKEAGVSYDYSNCNHPKWIELSNYESQIKTDKKSIEETLKTIKEPMEIVVDGGEVVTINPPIKKSKTIIEVR
ncbi:MAG: hypothetical protein LC109_09345 [Bacteroidia bacterium]|nr:hypothetical protein [Bacteroidia bacterium]